MIEKLKSIVLNFDIDNAEEVAKEVIANKINPFKAAKVLIDAIREVGDGFAKGEYFLPDLVCAAEVFKKAIPIITAEIEKQGKESKSLGKIVIGTVFGDIHSLGKGMVATLLHASGFEVIDLGVNVKLETFLDAIKEHKPDILAMSTLLTTTAIEQKNVIEGLKRENLRDKVKVIIGGSSINQEFADLIGADGYGATASDGVKVVKKLLGID